MVGPHTNNNEKNENDDDIDDVESTPLLVLRRGLGDDGIATSSRQSTSPQQQRSSRNRGTPNKQHLLLGVVAVTAIFAAVSFLLPFGGDGNGATTATTTSKGGSYGPLSDRHSQEFTWLKQQGGDLGSLPLEGHPKNKTKVKKKAHQRWISPPEPEKRCNQVVRYFQERNEHVDPDELAIQYAAQSVDANVFYRATAGMFWLDFNNSAWGNYSNSPILSDKALPLTLADGTPLEPKSTWTWVTGDQHLSNFGAWRNRGNEVVYSVNDFDEAAIYDFHIDVLRVAVSVCSHAHTNGLSKKQIRNVLQAFTDTYVQTIVNYVGNEKAKLYELTPETATGTLKTFLEGVKDDKSASKQIRKFTDIDDAGNRYFIKDDETRLVEVEPEIEAEIKEAFLPHNYRATMMKVGWHVHQWDDDYFTILDIAKRVGSGVGSYGVDRYYVLLKGEDNLLTDEGEDGAAVILDVKYEPPPAVSQVLSDDDTAWYKVMFPNEAARAVFGQRQLTSYVDPFTGWVIIGGKAFVVRQRSPWKKSPDLDSITDPDDFVDFMEQVAVATATSHVRGTASKSPGEFKEVITSILGKWSRRKRWGNAVANWAASYRKQVVKDYECFKAFINKNYPLP